MTNLKMFLFVPHRSMNSVYELIRATLEDPFQLVNVEDVEEKEISRVQCSTNVLHQADQILRKLVAMEVLRSKGSTFNMHYISYIDMPSVEIYATNKISFGKSI